MTDILLTEELALLWYFCLGIFNRKNWIRQPLKAEVVKITLDKVTILKLSLRIRIRSSRILPYVQCVCPGSVDASAQAVWTRPPPLNHTEKGFRWFCSFVHLDCHKYTIKRSIKASTNYWQTIEFCVNVSFKLSVICWHWYSTHHSHSLIHLNALLLIRLWNVSFMSQKTEQVSTTEREIMGKQTKSQLFRKYNYAHIKGFMQRNYAFNLTEGSVSQIKFNIGFIEGESGRFLVVLETFEYTGVKCCISPLTRSCKQIQ